MAKKSKGGGAGKDRRRRGPVQRTIPDRFAHVTVPPEMDDPARREEWGLPQDDDEPGACMVELNLQHISGLGGAAAAFLKLYEEVVGKPGEGGESARNLPVRVGRTYYACQLSANEWHGLVRRDEASAEKAAAEKAAAEKAAGEQGGSDEAAYRAIYRIWPDFPVKGLVDRSISTIKADAALRAFDAAGDGVVWAVIDSGIQGDHLHFERPAKEGGHTLRNPLVAELHRCFCEVVTDPDAVVPIPRLLPDPDLEPVVPEGEAKPDAEQLEQDRKELVKLHVEHALRDEFGHGSHVAGIIAGGVTQQNGAGQVVVLERRLKSDPDGNKVESERVFAQRKLSDPARLRGVAPRCLLISLRVLDSEGRGRASQVIRALEYIRESLNDNPKLMRVHGVNLSVGYEFDPEMFACGQSPLCAEVDRLVQSGVVVVAAAGNTGFGTVDSDQRTTRIGLSNTINDPGNAALAITVGSTHRDMPHTYGVSYFSSKGPTGDGRIKPDLVAPGERITSCAAGKKLDEALAQRVEGTAAPGDPSAAKALTAGYVDDSGTSMAAPHVSGAIAAFLSIRREFIGKPQEVKRIFLESATPLGRERYFEGHGLVDLMRAIQSV